MNSLRNIVFLVILFPLGSRGFSQDTISLDSAQTSSILMKAAADSGFIKTDFDTNRLVILFVGDIMGHDTQIEGAFNQQTGNYNYEPVFRYMKNYFLDADIVVGNLEVTLAGPPFKGYPQFSSPDELALEARSAGFDMLVTANNHALDRGEQGFKRTLFMLDSLGFLRAGTYNDSLERDSIYPVILEKNGIRLALLNYTYGTNGLKIPPPFIINRIDTALMSTDLAKAKLAEPDYTLVFMHWGKEYERTENDEQRMLANHIIRNGADAIIGSHPHVVQPIREIKIATDSLKSYPVVYSLGNFVSNQRAQYKDGGIVAELHISNCGDSTWLDSLFYLPYWVWRQDRNDGKSTFYVVPVALYEQDPVQFDLNASDKYRLERFAADIRHHLKDAKESNYYKKEKRSYANTTSD